MAKHINFNWASKLTSWFERHKAFLTKLASYGTSIVAALTLGYGVRSFVYPKPQVSEYGWGPGYNITFTAPARLTVGDIGLMTFEIKNMQDAKQSIKSFTFTPGVSKNCTVTPILGPVKQRTLPAEGQSVTLPFALSADAAGDCFLRLNVADAVSSSRTEVVTMDIPMGGRLTPQDYVNILIALIGFLGLVGAPYVHFKLQHPTIKE